MEKNDDLIDINEAAQLLGVAPVTLRKWDSDGKLLPIRVGERGHRRYKRSDLQQFLTKTQQPRKGVEWDSFEHWMKTEKMWREEAPGMPITLQSGCLKMVEFQKWIKPGFTNFVFMYENDFFYQALSVEESLAHCRGHFELLHNNQEQLRKVFVEWDEAVHLLDKLLNRFHFTAFEKLSNEQLVQEFNKLDSTLERFWTITLITEAWGPFIDDEYFPQFQKIVGNPTKAKEAFAMLTLPEQSSFIAEEHKDTLRMAIKFLSSPAERKKLIETPNEDYLAYMYEDYSEFFDSLQKHQQQFFWIQNSYSEWTILGLADFLNFLRDIAKAKNATEWKEELERLEKQTHVKEQRQKWLEELKLDKKVLDEIEYIRKISWFKDERKRSVVKMLHHVFRFCHEVGKRAGIDPKLIAYARVHEFASILNGSFSVETLQHRRKLCVDVSQVGDKQTLYTGNEAAIIKKYLFDAVKLEKGASIVGNVACRGEEMFVRGKVKIILNPKDQRIHPDEILVTSMTRPDFLQLMKQARAIITDEGGITCHAAIVSREMNKPCIIGTQHATKALQNGDEVEMRMNHGIINIKHSS